MSAIESIVLVHGCRQVSELAYGEELVAKLRDDELFGPLLSEKLIYYPTVTREPFRNRGRITDLITSEQLFNDIHQRPLDIETDRIMMCGSPGMLEELRQLFETRGFLEGSHNEPGHFVIEKAFVGALRCRPGAGRDPYRDAMIWEHLTPSFPLGHGAMGPDALRRDDVEAAVRQ